MSIESVAAAAMIGQERVTKTFHVAITGCAEADLMALIRYASDDAALSARRVQWLLECCAKLYKDLADQADVMASLQKNMWPGQAGTTSPSPTPPYVTSSGSGLHPIHGALPHAQDGKYSNSPELIKTHADMMREWESIKPHPSSIAARQSGTHTPSINAPDSVKDSMGWPVD